MTGLEVSCLISRKHTEVKNKDQVQFLKTLKNSVSAGVKKSVCYGGEILKKMLRGLA